MPILKHVFTHFSLRYVTKWNLDCLYWPVAHYIAKKAEDLVIVPGRSPIYMAEDLDIYMAEDLDTLYMAGRIGFWVGDWAGYICRSRIDLSQYNGMSAVAVCSYQHWAERVSFRDECDAVWWVLAPGSARRLTQTADQINSISGAGACSDWHSDTLILWHSDTLTLWHSDTETKFWEIGSFKNISPGNSVGKEQVHIYHSWILCAFIQFVEIFV